MGRDAAARTRGNASAVREAGGPRQRPPAGLSHVADLSPRAVAVRASLVRYLAGRSTTIVRTPRTGAAPRGDDAGAPLRHANLTRDPHGAWRVTGKPPGVCPSARKCWQRSGERPIPFTVSTEACSIDCPLRAAVALPGYTGARPYRRPPARRSSADPSRPRAGGYRRPRRCRAHGQPDGPSGTPVMPLDRSP